MSVQGAEMTPDAMVWISTARVGIGYHLIAESGRKTVCGRYIGSDGEVLRGHVQPLATVLELYGSQPCKPCTGSAERVMPGRSRW